MTDDAGPLAASPASRSRVVLGAAALVLVAVLAAFAVSLANSQSKSRRDAERRLPARAQVGANLTEKLFVLAAGESQAANARRFGAERVSASTMAQAGQQGNNRYLALLDQDGRIIAASPGVSDAVRRAIEAKPKHVASVLAGRSYGLSDLLRPDPGAPQLEELAQAFTTPFGRRVLVSGADPRILYAFIGGYVGALAPIKGGHAYVVDSKGFIVAGPDPKGRPGRRISEPGLLGALADSGYGSFGDDRYFGAVSVPGSSWRVVETAPGSALFATVRGGRKWVPWMLLAAFALAGAGMLVLFARVSRRSAQLGEANRRLDGANQALAGRAADLAQSNEELDRANHALDRRAAELARSNAELDQFAAIASHDLQEPLRKLETFAERLSAMEADRLSERGQDYLSRMLPAAQRMRALIEDLLTFSRVGTRARRLEQVDLTDVARSVVEEMDVAMQAADATVLVDDLPTVSADPLQMHQLLQNLISNALKFHRPEVPSRVEVTGRVRGRFAELEVRDNGIGFEPEYGTRIFKVFERLHGRGGYAGTGIGLALCRKIAERHGGTVVAAGTPGEGATFSVTLALEPLDELAPLSVLTRDAEPEEAESPYAPV